MTDANGAAEARWAAAANLADGVMDEGVPKRRRRVFIWVTTLITGSWLVGFIIAVLFLADGDANHSSIGPSVNQIIAQLVFLFLGLLVGIVGFVWARRTGNYITRWRAVASPLNRLEKKSVRRQIAGKDPIDERRLPIILAVARQNRRATLGITPIYSALVLFAIATAVGSNELFIKLLELAVAILFVFVALQLVVAYRKAGTFIDSNSSPTTAPSSSTH
jgi:hypothetical protein